MTLFMYKTQNPHAKVVVAIPIYKEIPSQDDLLSIRQCFKILAKYPIVAAKPKELSLKNYPFSFNGVEEFDGRYFEGIKGYNELMLSSVFYNRFLNSSYILIYQTDAFVFSDQLSYWCDLNYDYIGAPWLYRDYIDKTKYLKESIKGWIHRRWNIKDQISGLPTEIQFHNVVGNGGFSLRRVSVFHHLCKKYRSEINGYLLHSEKHYNEDVFWSIEVNRKRRHIKVPSFKKALHFAIESYPTLAWSLVNQNLPFGCHGWDKCREFWKPIFKEQGYDI